jgi:hypothetical protein
LKGVSKDAERLRDVAFRGLTDGDAALLFAIAERLESQDGDTERRLEYQLKMIDLQREEIRRLRAACQRALRLKGDWRHDAEYRETYEAIQDALKLENI